MDKSCLVEHFLTIVLDNKKKHQEQFGKFTNLNVSQKLTLRCML